MRSPKSSVPLSTSQTCASSARGLAEGVASPFSVGALQHPASLSASPRNGERECHVSSSMATPSPTLPPPHAVYTVDRAVGRSAPNDRLDVLLVQVYLLLFTEISQREP